MRATIIALETPPLAAMLRNSGHTQSEVPTLLIAASQGKSMHSRAFAIALLGEMGADAQSAVPTLRKLLKDPNLLVRRFAASSILRIDVDRRTTTQFRVEEMTSDQEFLEIESLISEEREAHEAQCRAIARFIMGCVEERLVQEMRSGLRLPFVTSHDRATRLGVGAQPLRSPHDQTPRDRFRTLAACLWTNQGESSGRSSCLPEPRHCPRRADVPPGTNAKQ